MHLSSVWELVFMQFIFINLMQCWLRWILPRACYCCSAWHWSEVAGTSPSDAPQDQPDPVQYSYLWEARERIIVAPVLNVHALYMCVSTEWKGSFASQLLPVDFNYICSGYFGTVIVCWCWISPCLLSLEVGVAVGQGHRPEHFRVRSFPVRHACCSSLHCNTKTHMHWHTHTPAISTRALRWSKMSYCCGIDQIFMRWPTVYLHSNLRLVPERVFQPLLADKVKNSDPKDKA